MNIAKIELWALRIPLNVRFKHASAERSATESVWVEVTDSQGVTGFGEACPRPYVTSETVASSANAIERWRPDLLRLVHSVGDLRAWVSARREEIDRAPAAWCAVELAVLDLFARRSAVSLDAVLGLPELTGTFRYTAILGDQSSASFEAQLKKYQEWGFTAYKIKLGRDARANTAKLACALTAGLERAQLRVDANNLWRSPTEALPELEPLASAFWAIEEPLVSGDFSGLRRISDALGLPIILDESFAQAEHFAAIDNDPAKWIINLRISKMGGLIRSLEVARLACELGVPVIVGAQVGETTLLTRSALTVANFAKSNLRGQEGAFGKILLQTDVVPDPITFGRAGELLVHGSFSTPPVIIRPDGFVSPP